MDPERMDASQREKREKKTMMMEYVGRVVIHAANTSVDERTRRFGMGCCTARPDEKEVQDPVFVSRRYAARRSRRGEAQRRQRNTV